MYTINPDYIGDYFIAYPMDEITIMDHSFSEGNTTVSMDVIHSADSDYVWIFYGLLADNGYLMSPVSSLHLSSLAISSHHLSLIRLNAFIKV